MVPPSNAAHEWYCPEQMLVAVRPVPRSTVAGRFPGGGMYDPVPSCPLEFAPKHFTLPSLSTAQLKALPMLSDPVETLVAVLPEPRSIAFASGIDLAVVSPYPRRASRYSVFLKVLYRTGNSSCHSRMSWCMLGTTRVAAIDDQFGFDND